MAEKVHFDVEATLAEITKEIGQSFAEARADETVNKSLLDAQEAMTPFEVAGHRAVLEAINAGREPTEISSAVGAVCGKMIDALGRTFGPHEAARALHTAAVMAADLDHENFVGAHQGRHEPMKDGRA